MTTAFYVQDSYDDRPAQPSSAASVGSGSRATCRRRRRRRAGSSPRGWCSSGVNIGGVDPEYTVQKSFDAVRENPLWKNWGPRVAATYDLFGTGKTASKASWGRYLDQISTGTPPNPNANINQSYVWNDLNGDLVFQPGNASWDGLKYVGGEFGALQQHERPRGGALRQAREAPLSRRDHRELDHELFPEVLLSVAYLRTREKDIRRDQVDNHRSVGSLYTPITLTDPGRDGVLGTGDEQPITVYNQNSRHRDTPKTINDDRLAPRYNGLDLIVTKRYDDGWTVLAGYTYSHTKVDLTSLANPNTPSSTPPARAAAAATT